MGIYCNIWMTNSRKNAAFGEEESICSSWQCTSWLIHYINGKNQWVKVWIASSCTLFTRFSYIGLFSLLKLEKMAQWLNICKQWRSGFWSCWLFDKLDGSQLNRVFEQYRLHWQKCIKLKGNECVWYLQFHSDVHLLNKIINKFLEYNNTKCMIIFRK